MKKREDTAAIDINKIGISFIPSSTNATMCKIATVGLGVSDFGYRISHYSFRCCFGGFIWCTGMAMAKEKQETESPRAMHVKNNQISVSSKDILSHNAAAFPRRSSLDQIATFARNDATEGIRYLVICVQSLDMGF